VDPRTDENLIADHISGDASAFEALTRRYVDELFRFLVRFVGSAAAAEDLTQETLLQVHVSAGGFDPGRTFRPWLYTIAANKGRDFLRSRARRQELLIDSSGRDGADSLPGGSVAADEESAEGELGRKELRDEVRRIVVAMPEHLRLVLLLGYYQQLPYAEIATILDIPVGTVKSRLHSAVTQFGNAWKAAHGESGV
jgi:RNA polymerase sigma-70 factor (ECF subfamily)